MLILYGKRKLPKVRDHITSIFCFMAYAVFKTKISHQYVSPAILSNLYMKIKKTEH